MVIIILVCVGFGTSVHLTNAYGMAGQNPLNIKLRIVATVLIVTDVLLALVMYLVWGLIFVIPIFFLLFFGLVDGVFWACNYPLFFLSDGQRHGTNSKTEHGFLSW